MDAWPNSPVVTTGTGTESVDHETQHLLLGGMHSRRWHAGAQKAVRPEPAMSTSNFPPSQGKQRKARPSTQAATHIEKGIFGDLQEFCIVLPWGRISGCLY